MPSKIFDRCSIGVYRVDDCVIGDKTGNYYFDFQVDYFGFGSYCFCSGVGRDYWYSVDIVAVARQEP